MRFRSPWMTVGRFELSGDTSNVGSFVAPLEWKAEGSTWVDYQIDPDGEPTGNRKERRAQAARDRKARKGNR